MLLGAMVVAVGLAVLVVFVNQSVLAGHSSSGSIIDFPKNDIRELRTEIINEVYLIGADANHLEGNLDDRKALFDDRFGQFLEDVRYVYSSKGSDVSVMDVRYNEVLPGEYINDITFYLYYYNGDTNYGEKRPYT